MTDKKNEVIFGQDGILFLDSQRHQTFDVLTGEAEIEKKFLNNFSKNLSDRAEFARSIGAQYVHLVAPDKHAVYRNEFPIKFPESLAEIFRRKTKADFLYPVEDLLAIGGGYKKTDTHWNIKGQICVATALGTRLGLPEELVNKANIALLEGLHLDEALVAGDLGSKLTPPHTEPNETLSLSWKTHQFSNRVKAGNDGRIQVLISESPTAQGRLLIFGDSFLGLTLGCLSAFFREIFFCRTRFFHHEIAAAMRPDYIISQNVERYLRSVQLDREAPPLLLMAQLGGREVHYDEKSILAISAMLAPNSRYYQRFIDSLRE